MKPLTNSSFSVVSFLEFKKIDRTVEILSQSSHTIIPQPFFSFKQQLKNAFAVCFLQSNNYNKSNGKVKSDESEKTSEDVSTTQNAQTNKPIINSNKASDYYIKSEDLPTSNLTQRRVVGEQQ